MSEENIKNENLEEEKNQNEKTEKKEEKKQKSRVRPKMAAGMKGNTHKGVS